MSWPKGLSRREYNKQRKGEVVPDAVPDVGSPTADNAQPASVEARAPTKAERAAKYEKEWRALAGNDWDEQPAEDSPDRFHIPRELFPEGMDLYWCTLSVRGQPTADRVNTASRAGWQQVKDSSFDSWHKRVMGSRFEVDASGNLHIEGTTGLFARPMPLSERARKRDEARAREQIALKEAAFKGGEIAATGADHPSALAHNRISRSMERIDVPKE